MWKQDPRENKKTTSQLEIHPASDLYLRPWANSAPMVTPSDHSTIQAAEQCLAAPPFAWAVHADPPPAVRSGAVDMAIVIMFDGD